MLKTPVYGRALASGRRRRHLSSWMAPVTKLASSLLARYSTPLAISPGSPIRPSRTSFSMSAKPVSVSPAHSSAERASMSVLIAPGRMQLTRTSGASSKASALVRLTLSRTELRPDVNQPNRTSCPIRRRKQPMRFAVSSRIRPLSLSNPLVHPGTNEPCPSMKIGGAEEDRTPDLRIANATLSRTELRPRGTGIPRF